MQTALLPAAAETGQADRATDLRARALEAQTALLPYALGFFAFGLLMFAWASSFAANAGLMSVSLAIFAINWGVFYALAGAVRRDPRLQNVVNRTRVHLLGGLLWVVAINQISLFALGAGAARETLLILSAGAAAASYFFLAPLLPALLLLGPLAAAGPIIGLFLLPETRHMGMLASGALAFALALSIVVNRILERQFLLGYERDRLAETCEVSLAEAERLARSKSALLATLSDEVRAGLTGVAHVLAAAAAGGSGRGPSREQLNAALGASRDLIEVLNATLDSETAEDGQLSVRCEPIDATRLVRDLVLLNQPLAAAKGLELAGHVEPDVAGGAVTADPVRTRQILSNLIGNALKYTVRGRVEVRVRRDGAGRVRFEVADTGPGLSRDEIEDAFRPFTRIERTSAGAPGAGVGLSLSRKLAMLMGGDVAAESALGVGSCFWLDLPFAEGAKPVAAIPPGDAGERALKVMVADGDALSAAVTRAALEELGHQVVQAQSARRAAELLKICEVDLIVVGFAEPQEASRAARLLRAAPGASAASPILALIDGDADEAATRMAAGCSGVMRRPVNAQSLARAIASLTAGRVAANAA